MLSYRLGRSMTLMRVFRYSTFYTEHLFYWKIKKIIYCFFLCHCEYDQNDSKIYLKEGGK